MPLLQPNAFTSYILTQDEQQQGSLLTSLNICAIQNLISQIAQEKLSLLYDPTNPLKFAQQEAELHGQMLILQQLVNNSNDAAAAQLKLNLDSPDTSRKSTDSYFTLQEN